MISFEFRIHWEDWVEREVMYALLPWLDCFYTMIRVVDSRGSHGNAIVEAFKAELASQQSTVDEDMQQNRALAFRAMRPCYDRDERQCATACWSACLLWFLRADHDSMSSTAITERAA